MTETVLSKVDQVHLEEFNARFSKVVSDEVHLRRPFIRVRYDYIKQHCQDLSGVVYDSTNIAEMAGVLTSVSYDVPGDERDPWAYFTGRHKGLSEEDYINVLFQSERHGLKPKELFFEEFNAYLQSQRVPVRLVTNGVQTFWVLTR